MRRASDRYLKYQEIVDFLETAAAEFPRFLRLHTIGRSPEGRNLLVAELTDRASGPASEKPAFWVDGNIHAIELAGSSACLHLIDTLLVGAQGDPKIAELLSTRVIYVAPRVSPDGAEEYLTTGRVLRSCPRPYPFEDEHRGLLPQDIDGDGQILQMRVEHPLGPWRQSERDPRLLVKRRPDDRGGRTFHLFAEGVFENFEGPDFKVPGVYGLDLNRNWPFEWVPESKQKGAGRFPLSEPETRAVAEFLAARPNVCGAVAYHTYGGVILRPYSTRGDEEHEPWDLEVYKALGSRGTELTGYPNVSVFHDFRYGLKDLIHGGFDDWMYDHLGAYCFTVEIWNPFLAAGIDEKNQFIRLYQHRTEEEDLKLLAWNDGELRGAGFEDWRPFEHPQLGRVEIGGWRKRETFYNPPGHRLEAECAKNTAFILAQVGATPLLRISRAERRELAPGLFKLTLEVENTGFLPTHVSELARKHKIAREPWVELSLPPGVELLMGEARHKLGHLDGMASVIHGAWVESSGFRGASSEQCRRVEWLVRGAEPIEATVHSDRGGVCRASF